MPKFKSISLEDLPGHYIRRLQQIAVGIFLDETSQENITPVQFAVLFATAKHPGMDQRTLAARIGFDTSTLGAVLDRLEANGTIRRNASPTDKRSRLLTVTPEGALLLERLMAPTLAAQDRMLAPLDEAERQTFMSLIKRIVEENNSWSRAAKTQ
jgi:DNA-binding MarR family transcriptional regulator